MRGRTRPHLSSEASQPDPYYTRRMTLRHNVKVRLLGLLRGCRIFSVVGSSPWRRRRLLILGYHGVSIDDEHLWDPLLFHSPECFRIRLEAIRRARCTVLPLSEGLEKLRLGTLPPRSVAITFDDGLVDFKQRAWPLLREFGMPVTMYQTTYYSERQSPVFPPYCRYITWKRRDHTLNLREITGADQRFDLASSEQREAASRAILQFADREGLSADDREGLLQRLSSLLELDDRPIREARILHLMKPDEIRELAEEGVDFQLHTHRHRTPLDRDLFVKEIVDNRDALLRSSGQAASHFAYPSGVHHRAFLPWLAEQGVASATTVESGLARSDSNPLLLPRLMDTNILADVEFEAWLTGARAMFPSSVRHARI